MIESMVGKRIKGLRQIKNWTQVELAERASISRSFISELELGGAQPTIGLLKAIADAFAVSVAYFVSDDEDVPLGSFADLLPDDVKSLLRSDQGLPYLQIAVKAKEFALDPEILQSLVETMRKVRDVAR